MAFSKGLESHEHGCACAACASGCGDDAAKAAAYDPFATTYSAPTGPSGAGLISGRSWADRALTFAFPGAPTDYDTNAAEAGVQYGSGEPLTGFAAMNPAQMAAVRDALDQYAAVSGLSFTELEDPGAATLRFAQSTAPSTAWGYYPSAFEEGGDAWFGTERGWYADPAKGGYGWHTIIHEIGHTVGLKHGHQSGAFGALEAFEDTMEHSVMTYRSFVDDPLVGGYSNEAGGYAQTLMQADIAALQQLYGANYDHNAGDTHYAWRPDTGETFVDGVGQGAPLANRIFMTVWDGGGVDTWDFSAFADQVIVDLAPGAGATLPEAQRAHLNRFEAGAETEILAERSVYAARLHEGDERALIENAIGGAGDDFMGGNRSDNELTGGRGTDALFGFAGRDTLIGEAGGDYLEGGRGADTLRGNGWHDELQGGHGWDVMFGGGGDDILIGGMGNDKMRGGAGADRFEFAAGDGMDRILDFEVGVDLIDLTALNASFGDLLIEDRAEGARVFADDVTIRLMRLDADDLSAVDFLF
ncbi:MAG: M10 family metallopeptidase C-terminal domain-containing protein [Pseudomonadota bacterium]